MKTIPVTRRTFLKTTAFAAGSYAILSRGIALAAPGSGSGSSDTGSSCKRKWVTRIEVEFNGQLGHQLDDTDKADWSGDHYGGILTYWCKTCENGKTSPETPVTAQVASGGYIYRAGSIVDSQLKQGSQTPWPPGTFEITTAFSSAGSPTAGFCVNNDGAYIRDVSDPTHKYRNAMKIHFQARPAAGSSGCIVFRDKTGFDEFVKVMKNTRIICKSRNACQVLNSVPLNVKYKGVDNPTYTWDRLKMGDPIPETDPTTRPPNP